MKVIKMSCGTCRRNNVLQLMPTQCIMSCVRLNEKWTCGKTLHIKKYWFQLRRHIKPCYIIRLTFLFMSDRFDYMQINKQSGINAFFFSKKLPPINCSNLAFKNWFHLADDEQFSHHFQLKDSLVCGWGPIFFQHSVIWTPHLVMGWVYSQRAEHWVEPYPIWGSQQS